MSDDRMQGLFITGTDTEVGKTSVATWIARVLLSGGRRVGIYKPACSGAETSDDGNIAWPDIERFSAALEGRFSRERICPQQFLAAAAPPVAARMEGRSVDERLLLSGAQQWESEVDWLLVEGVGGWLSPLSEHTSCADLAFALGCPVLVVARGGLGTINHTLLTLEAVAARGMECAGVVVNHVSPPRGDVSTDSNADEIAARSGVPILAEVAYRASIGLPLPSGFLRMDWCSLMRPLRSH